MDFESAHAVFGRSKSNYSYSHEEDVECSFKRCSCFVLLFLLLSIALLASIALVIIFALRPRKPIFTLQAIRLESFKIQGYEGPNVYISSVLMLLFNAQNPNKVGLRYSTFQLLVLYKGVPVGIADFPDFYQPAHSKNVSVQGRVVCEHLNVTEIAGGDLSKGRDYNVVFRLVGDITVRVDAWHATLPKIKVALDCEIKIDYRGGIFSKGSSVMKEQKVHFSNHPSFSEKCSVGVYI